MYSSNIINTFFLNQKYLMQNNFLQFENTLQLPHTPFLCLSLSSNADYLVTSNSQNQPQIYIMKPFNPTPRYTLSRHINPITVLKFHFQNSQTLAVASQIIKIYSLKQQSKPVKLQENLQEFSLKRQQSIKNINKQKCEEDFIDDHWEEFTLDGHTSKINSLSFSENLLASGGYDKKIVIWDFQEKKQLHVLNNHQNIIKQVKFHKNGEILLSMAIKDGIFIFDAKQNFTVLRKIEEFSYDHKPMNCSPDGKILAFGCQGEVKLWNLDSFTEIQMKKQDQVSFSRVEFVPRKKYLLGIQKIAGFSNIYVWEHKQLDLVEKRNIEGYITETCFSGDGRLWAASVDDNKVIICDTNKLLKNFKQQQDQTSPQQSYPHTQDSQQNQNSFSIQQKYDKIYQKYLQKRNSLIIDQESNSRKNSQSTKFKTSTYINDQQKNNQTKEVNYLNTQMQSNDINSQEYKSQTNTQLNTVQRIQQILQHDKEYNNSQDQNNIISNQDISNLFQEDKFYENLELQTQFKKQTEVSSQIHKIEQKIDQYNDFQQKQFSEFIKFQYLQQQEFKIQIMEEINELKNKFN